MRGADAPPCTLDKVLAPRLFKASPGGTTPQTRSNPAPGRPSPQHDRFDDSKTPFAAAEGASVFSILARNPMIKMTLCSLTCFRGSEGNTTVVAPSGSKSIDVRAPVH